ncbi:MAG: hypothetical protein ACOC7U_01545 [Spirochaetota bacterium]
MKNIRYIFLLTILFLLLFGCREKTLIEETVPRVSISVLTSGPITIGDPIDVALSVYHHKNDHISLPENEEAFSPFVLKDSTTKKHRRKQDIRKTLAVYTLCIYRTGTFELGPFQVDIGKKALQTRALKISILSVLSGRKNPGLKDVVPPHTPRLRAVFIISVILGAAVLAFLGYLAAKHFKNRKIPAEKPQKHEVPIDPYQYSINELENLRENQDGVDIKTLYSRASEILRFYVGKLLEINAPEMTTNQLRNKLIGSKQKEDRSVPPTGSGGMFVDFIGILARADLVKFARHAPSTEQAGSDLERSILVVRKINQAFEHQPEPHSTQGLGNSRFHKSRSSG